MRKFQVVTTNWIGVFEVDDKNIVRVAPSIINWVVGHTLGEVQVFYRNKGDRVVEVKEENNI